MEERGCKVCVTGGAGYIGSWLVKKLLLKGYIVHATVRNLDDQSKVGLLKSFPNADTRLKLFEADIYNPDEFEKAIEGCEFVFHVATPLQHSQGSKYENLVEATVDGAKRIMMSCIRSGTVKRFIYTSSIVTASPMKDEGTGFKDSIDESCWTPLHLSFPCSTDRINEYMASKTPAEKEILSYDNNKNGGQMEVVTLDVGLVGGDTLLSYMPGGVAIYVSQLTGNADYYQTIKFLDELLGKVPVIHIDDVCEAHVFCMEKPSIRGRFLCASSCVSSEEITNYYRENYPGLSVKLEHGNGVNRETKWSLTKLREEGFEYKYDAKMILDDCIKCARKMGDLQ